VNCRQSILRKPEKGPMNDNIFYYIMMILKTSEELLYQAHLYPHYVSEDYPTDRNSQMQQWYEVETIYPTWNRYKVTLHRELKWKQQQSS
jgi:hypothetical protein